MSIPGEGVGEEEESRVATVVTVMDGIGSTLTMTQNKAITARSES